MFRADFVPTHLFRWKSPRTVANMNDTDDAPSFAYVTDNFVDMDFVTEEQLTLRAVFWVGT
jgi:hypothetical protein